MTCYFWDQFYSDFSKAKLLVNDCHYTTNTIFTSKILCTETWQFSVLKASSSVSLTLMWASGVMSVKEIAQCVTAVNEYRISWWCIVCVLSKSLLNIMSDFLHTELSLFIIYPCSYQLLVAWLSTCTEEQLIEKDCMKWLCMCYNNLQHCLRETTEITGQTWATNILFYFDTQVFHPQWYASSMCTLISDTWNMALLNLPTCYRLILMWQEIISKRVFYSYITITCKCSYETWVIDWDHQRVGDKVFTTITKPDFS